MDSKELVTIDTEKYKSEYIKYHEFYDFIKSGPKDGFDLSSLQQSFFNCMAMAARLSFTDKFDLCAKFCGIARDFMYLGGFNDEPDDMPWVISSIEWTSAQTMSCSHDRKTKEQEYESELIDRFDSIKEFSEYKFIKSQKVLGDGDRIDIFAIHKNSDRPVLIELKVGNKSGHQQLINYATHFSDPILISISEKRPLHERLGIIYCIYKDLFKYLPAENKQ